MLDKLEEGKPCSHRGCLQHITHPCERCGRIGGRSITTEEQLDAAIGVRKALMAELNKLTTTILSLDEEIRALFELQKKEQLAKFEEVLDVRSN